MNELAIYRLLNVALTAAAVGLEREAILGKVAEMQSKGASPEDIADALRVMRDKAISEAESRLA